MPTALIGMMGKTDRCCCANRRQFFVPLKAGIRSYLELTVSCVPEKEL
jgi:hypothetical protein